MGRREEEKLWLGVFALLLIHGCEYKADPQPCKAIRNEKYLNLLWLKIAAHPTSYQLSRKQKQVNCSVQSAMCCLLFFS